MNYVPTKYEVESLGDRVFVFVNDEFEGTEVVLSVDVQNTDSDSNVDDKAYGLLQKLFPISWHDWRLVDKEDNF